jgi:hypothetical protein
VFIPRAGMLGWSLCHRRREVVAHPVPLTAYVETGEPTGIALLHPWANRLASPEYEPGSSYRARFEIVVT